MSIAAAAGRGNTVGERLTFYNNRPTGFDYLRLALALGVVLWHSYWLNDVNGYAGAPVEIGRRLILPMFFALSGFLISGSLVRITTLGEFLTMRAIRILPALAVEVTLSAIIVGALFTALPLHDYFTSGGFFNYFNNLYGNVQFHLPGVFLHNPTTRVNYSLWTIPYELECYLAITALWLFGVIGHRRWLLLVVLAAQVAIPARDALRGVFDQRTGILSGRMLVLAFLYGVVIFFYRDRIILRKWLLAAALVVALALLAAPQTTYFAALPAAYATVALGLTNPKKIPILMAGDYSYGIYLYSTPVQQAVVALIPTHREWWFNFALAILPIALCAAFSWHVVEKPVLGRRKTIVALTARLIAVVAEPLRAIRRSVGRSAA